MYKQIRTMIPDSCTKKIQSVTQYNLQKVKVTNGLWKVKRLRFLSLASSISDINLKKYKGIYDRFPLTQYHIPNINLKYIAFSLPSEVRFSKSWPHFNFHGI